MAERFRLRATRSAQSAIEALRGRAKEAYDDLEPALKAQGCREAGYRLLAPDGEGYSEYCCKHLSDDWRVITTFGPNLVSIEAVGRHNGPGFYAHLGELGIGPVGQKRDEKPDCCSEEGWPHLGLSRAERRKAASSGPT